MKFIKEKYYSTGWPDDDPEHETDGTSLEETHYIPDDAVNDNLDIATPRRVIDVKDRRTGRRVAIIDVNDQGDEKERFCPHCEQYGFKHKLGHKIKKKGEPEAPDDDQWTSCYECGNTFPLYQTHPEPEIKDSEETTQSPFENESIFMSTKRRKHRDRLRETSYDDDPDVAAAQRKYGIDNVRIIK